MVDYIPNQDSNNINEDYNNNMEAENYVVSDSSTEHYEVGGIVTLPAPDPSLPRDKNYWAVVLGLVCIIVVIGNVLVIVSVFKERVLQNITNYFIVSLAVADLLVAGCVMPFSVYVVVNWGMWDMPKMVCDFYIASDVICSTSSIFNLVAISIDRYMAVTSPISYSQHKDKTARAYISIVLIWLLSIGIGSPIMLGANSLPENMENRFNNITNTTTYATSNPGPIFSSTEATSQLVEQNETRLVINETIKVGGEFVCAFYNPDFIIYSSLGSFYIPCVIMVFLYIRIFSTLRARARVRMPKPVKTSLRANKTGKTSLNNIAGCNNGMTIKSNKQSNDNEDEKMLQKSPNISQSDSEDEDEEDEEEENQNHHNGLHPNGNDEVITNPIPSADNDTLNSSSPSTNKPCKADKASGPDTSIFERSSKCRKNQKNHSPQQDTISVKDSQSTGEATTPASCKGTKNGNQFVMRVLVTETKSGKTTSKLATPSGGSGNCNHEKSSCELDESHNEEAKKILSFISLSKLRNGAGKQGKSAKNGAPLPSSQEPPRLRKEKPSARKERKATKTLAIVLGVFLVCWVPFFTCNILNAICIKFDLGWYPGDLAFNLTTWLGYTNSCINPLIYTIFNPEFRKAFKKLLHIK